MTVEDKNLHENDDPEEEEEEEDEEDLVDPMTEVKEKCGNSPHCAHYKEKFEACEERVNGRSQTAEECTEELFDFLHCTDHCVAKEMFNHLK